MASQVMVTGLSVYRSYEVAETIELRLLDAGRSSVASSELSDARAHGHPGAGGRSIRHQLRPMARRRAARRAARDPDRWCDRRREVHDRHAPRAPAGHRARRRDGRLDPGGDALDALRRAHADTPRLVVPDGHGRPGADATFRRARRRLPGADGGGLGRHRGADQASGRRRDEHRDRRGPRGPGVLRPGRPRRPASCRFRWSSRWRRRADTSITSLPGRRACGPAERYANNFGNIRKLQRYIKSQALSHGVPIIPNHSFDQAISAALDLVMDRATARVAQEAERATTAGRTTTGRTRAGQEQQTEEQQTRPQQVGQQGRTA